jgi:HK97 family phage portal protein
MAKQKKSIKDSFIGFLDRTKRKTFYGLFNYGDFDYVDYEKRGGYDLYKLSLYLNKAINKRAEKVGETTFVVEDLKGTMVTDTGGQAEWIYRLFTRPNKLMSSKQFFSTLQKQKDLLGRAYVYCIYKSSVPELFGNETGMKNEVVEMHLLDPNAITEVFDKETNTITQYKYQTKTEGEKIYEATQIIRIVRVDPANPLGAETLIEAGKKVISTGIQLDDYQSNILKNGGSVKGVFKFKDTTLTAEEIETQKDRYREQLAGSKKAGTPLFIGGDADYTQLGLNPEEIGYLASKNCNLNDICVMTGVPKSILGNFDEIKYDNAQASYRIFLQETIEPEVKEIVDAFNYTIIPENYNLSYKSIVPEDKVETKMLLEAGSNTYCLTTNEKRRMIGLDDIKEGDTILAPFSLMPIGEQKPTEAKSILKKSFEPIIKEEIKQSYAESQIKYIDQRSKQLEQGVINFANDQEKRVFKKISLKKSIKKGFKLELDEMYDDEVALAISFITPYLEELISDAGNGALDLLGLSKPLTMTERMKKIMEARAKFYAETTTETTFKKLTDTLTQGFEEDETIVQLTERVQNVYKEYPKYRAELIARTESTVSNNEGLLEGYRQSEVVAGKEWIAILDDRTRPEHVILNGEIVGLDKNFSNGLPYPQEPNCRCVIGPAIEE